MLHACLRACLLLCFKSNQIKSNRHLWPSSRNARICFAAAHLVCQTRWCFPCRVPLFYTILQPQISFDHIRIGTKRRRCYATANLELSIIVLRRWAIVNTVQSENWLRMVFWMSSSVLWSIEAVASSSIRILVFLSKARAKHISCLWPTLN